MSTETSELIAIDIEEGDEGEDYYTVTARFINMTAEDIRTLADDLETTGWNYHAERLKAETIERNPVSGYHEYQRRHEAPTVYADPAPPPTGTER